MDKKHKYSDTIEQKVKGIVIDSEYTTGKQNNDSDEFEAILDMLECVRTEKNADWRSDIFLPQFFSQIVTQASNDASQMFQSRDFVETYITDGTRTKQAEATERLINRTLNQKHLRYYHKYMRAKMFNYLKGECYARYWWEKKVETYEVDRMTVEISEDIDQYGNPLVSPNQIPALVEKTVKVPQKTVLYDRVNFAIIDPRNIFMDNTYCYTLQEKRWVIVVMQTSLDELEDQAEQFGYFNLDVLKDKASTDKRTESADRTDNKNKNENKPDKTPVHYYDKVERFGKFWVVVKETKDDGYPSKVEPGYDQYGVKKENAELIECLITFATNSNTCTLIGFEPQKCRDATGNPYRPLNRGLQYIHPSEDMGIGDGRPARELQIAMNDTFNISNDRTMMATLPTFKIKKYGNEDNDTIRFEPEHLIELEDPNDLQEVVISDNVTGAQNQIGFLKGMMEQALALSPTTMGMLPEHSSTTATAVAGADARTNARSNYKSLTFEHTFLCEHYWMINQLTYQYAEPDTMKKLLSDKVMDFDPDGDYYYKPVSQSIETEYSKNNKIKNLLTFMGYIQRMPHPDVAKMINYIYYKFNTLMGAEWDEFGKTFLDPNKPMQMGPQGQGQQTQQQQQSVSNQYGQPQTDIETAAREAYVR
jgi:hypothetical protein